MAVQLKREGADFTPVGVWFATPQMLQSRFLPGKNMERWARAIHESARPPLLDDEQTLGTWEDWVEYALDALSNGHDLWVIEVEPEATLDLSYARYVLELTGDALKAWKPKSVPNVSTLAAGELRGARLSPEARA